MENSLTLSQFQALLGNTIRCNPALRNVWVQAELSDLRYSGGHCYMELVEKDSGNNLRAKMRATMWSNISTMLHNKFEAATGQTLASGMKLLLRGSIAHHSLYGISFSISDIDPSYTLGEMERLRREILDRLNREGILNANKQHPVPRTPQRIAVISAEGAAGYGDFMNQLHNCPEKFALYPLLFPAVMQGDRTAESVMAALHRIELSASMWDVVVIIRGGGATTDLNGFDNYELARRVATFPLPVIVGIGHERDRTVLDEIACVRCKTPTAAAAFIIDALRASYQQAVDLVTRIAGYVKNALNGEQMRLANISQAMPAQARNVLLRNKLRLNTAAHSLPSLVGNRVLRQKLRLSTYASRLSGDIAAVNSRQAALLQQLQTRLQSDAPAALQREELRLKRLGDMVRLLSPQNTLSRGYSITRVGGKAVTSVSQVPAGSVIETTLPDGSVSSKVL